MLFNFDHIDKFYRGYIKILKSDLIFS